MITAGTVRNGIEIIEVKIITIIRVSSYLDTFGRIQKQQTSDGE